MADLQELLNSIHVQLAEDLLERIKRGRLHPLTSLWRGNS